jgi:multidrug efflux pump subunit AcrB
MAPLVISVACLCFCIFSFFFLRRYITQKTDAARLLADYRAEVNHLIAEIDAATDRDSILVEARIKTLRKLIDDTDRRISVYMRELQRSRNSEAIYASLGRGIRAALDSKPSGDEQLLLEIEPPGSSASAPAATSAGAKDSKSAAQKKNAEKRKKEKTGTKITRQKTQAKPNIKVQIAEMSAKGLSPQEIASGLNLSLAEVELALNLLYRATAR